MTLEELPGRRLRLGEQHGGVHVAKVTPSLQIDQMSFAANLQPKIHRIFYSRRTEACPISLAHFDEPIPLKVRSTFRGL
jgi:hypothetical protein